VAQQIEAMKRAVASQGWELIGSPVVDDGLSASAYARKDRPAWAKVRAMIESGEVTAVAVWESSRLTRRLGEFADFRDLCERFGVLVLTSGGVIDYTRDSDRLGAAVGAVVDEHASRQTSARVKRAQAALARSGKPTKLAYGYLPIYGADRSLIAVELDPVAAPIVLECAARLVRGDSARTIAADLNARGVASPADARRITAGRETRDARWTTGGIRRMLATRAYIGVRVHGADEYPAIWPALFSEADHAVIVGMAGKLSGGPRGREIVHPLSGLLFCHKCEGAMRVSSRRAGKGYTCPSGCSWVDADKVEMEVYVATLQTLADPQFIRGAGDPARLSAIRAEVNALHETIAEAAMKAGKRQISVTMAAMIESQALADIAALDAEARAIRIPAGLPSHEVLAARWMDLSAERKRHYIRAVLGDRIIVLSGYTKDGKRRPMENRLRHPELVPSLDLLAA